MQGYPENGQSGDRERSKSISTGGSVEAQRNKGPIAASEVWIVKAELNTAVEGAALILELNEFSRQELSYSNMCKL